jgi:hypothetical protein
MKRNEESIMLTIDILFASVLALTVASAAAAIALCWPDRSCRSTRRVVVERLAYIALLGASAIIALLMAMTW